MEKKVQGQEFVSKHCLNGKTLRSHLPLISSDNIKAKAETTDDDMIDEILGTIEENGCSSSNVSAEKQQSQSSLIQEKMEELMMSDGNGNGSHDDQDLQDSYDLRENPKKSWKISDVRTMAVDEAMAVSASEAAAYLCKDCQKSFLSSRALAGHMRAHAVKGKKNLHICKKCSKGFESVRALYGHMKSHSKRPRLSASAAATTTTTKSEFDVDYPRKKRSVIRYNLTPNPSSPSPSTCTNANSAEFDLVDEVEDAAQCLMMLSRDFGSVDDNSVEFDSNSFQSQSQSQSHSQSQRREFSVTCADEEENPPPEKKMNSSSYRVTEINKFGSHNNVAAKDAEIEQEPKISRSASSDSGDSIRVEPAPEKDLRLGTLGLVTDQDDSELLLQSDPVEKKSSVGDGDGNGNGNPPDWKKRGYKCRTCNMIFTSHQALGGHRNRHKTIISSSSSGSGLTNNDEYVNYHNNGGQNQKSKDHECAVCFKVFPTGQALGGHKRAHYAGFTENKASKENTLGISNTSDHDLQQQILEASSSKSSHDHQQEVSIASAEIGDITHCGGGVNMVVIQGSSHCCSLSLCN